MKQQIKAVLSFVFNWPLWLALKLRADVMHDIYAKSWYDDVAHFPHLNFFELLAERPFYRILLFYRLRSWGTILRTIYPSYSHFRFNSWKEMSLGGGVYLDHPYCSVLNAKSIGMDLHIKHFVTIGNSHNGIPIIGDHVTIGCGAVIVGDIVVGDYVKIGANSVVVKNVPSNCTVVGNPAFIVKRDGKLVNEKL